MLWGDHPGPHFHVERNEYRALVVIESLVAQEGYLPQQDWRRVRQWASARQEELREAWNRAERKEPPGRIEPL